MRLVQLTIQRYRSIIKAEKLRLGDLTVLVGPNNEGKSNILQALVTSMRVLSEGRFRARTVRRYSGDRLRGEYDWERDFPHSLQQSNPDAPTIFNLDFELTPAEIDAFAEAVGSRLNGILPVGLSFNRDNRFTFSVRKQRHSEALTAKREEIEAFIGEHVHLQYIPATRTAEAALGVVEQMISTELQAAELDNEEYKTALMQIDEVQRPILEAIETDIKTSLQQLLPDVQDVELEKQPDRIRPRIRARVIIDDGTPTDLEFKGDGVQSLAALSLIRRYSQEGAPGRELILAVEEPEAHLHPRAIHEISTVLRETAGTQQVVVSTHSPLLVNRFDLASNIIVEKAQARPAKSVSELREVLGVRISDNLHQAEVVLVVEGPTDARALKALLAERSTKLRNSMESGVLALQPLFGGAKLPYVLSLLRESMCRVHALLDDDQAGHEAADKAREEGLLAGADETFTMYPGANEAEFEDLLQPTLYGEPLMEKFGVSVETFLAVPRTRGKWSDRMRVAFEHTGRQWNEEAVRNVKEVLAQSLEVDPAHALDENCATVIDGLVDSLELKLSPEG